jgi:hypothetical protein
MWVDEVPKTSIELHGQRGLLTAEAPALHNLVSDLCHYCLQLS